jgi:hypothetical protein
MNTRRTLGSVLVFALAFWLGVPDWVQAADQGSSDSLNAERRVAKAKPADAYGAPPLTIECRCRLLDAGQYNIIIAHEPKSSGAHWELFTPPGSGFLTAYLPGFEPDHVRSTVSVTDGKWRRIALVLEETHATLWIDGNDVASARLRRRSDARRESGPLVFGEIVSGGLGCKGEIDEVRISEIARDAGVAPDRAFEADVHTIGLWRFDELEKGNVYRDFSQAANHAVVTEPSASRQTVASPAPFRPTQGQVGVIAPTPDLPAARRMFRQALAELRLPSLRDESELREGLLREWEEQYWHIENQVAGRETPPGPPEQAFDAHALVWDTDGDPLGVALRRTRALLKRLEDMPDAPDLSRLRRDLTALQSAADAVGTEDATTRKRLFLVACALRRKIAFSNPLLDFDGILFVARGVYNGSRRNGLQGTNDAQGQHFHTQYYAFNSIPGGGLFMVKNFKTRPEIINVVEGSVVQNGRLKGRRLEGGAYLSPDLSYDGKEILFSWTENAEHKWVWSERTTWNIFKVQADGSNLTQLTDSPYNDFDAIWLPNGRVVFISERRGGYIRCFSNLPVPQHVMHSMKADGSDIRPISYFETGEWHPSVNNEGKIVYTRWDYVDRENCLGSNFWICYPDGRDPRAPHGNYPYPWHTFPDNEHGRDGRIGRPYTEMNIRAVPDSPLYVLTAAPHHGEAFGSLVMLDLRAPDDGFMSQLKRITPYVRFPESEAPDRLQYPYGAAWPLSEDFYLCNWWENIYLLDRFGNQTLVCENSLVFDGKINWDMRLVDPMPVKPRKRPPELPALTSQGEDAREDAPKARISVLNVYNSDLPFPEGTRILHLRVLQDIPKSNPQMNSPENMGYHWENTPRLPLGIVPVEQDGSAYFEAPVERELIFQALDENHMAVQTMRSVAYAHRGELLTCAGCHDPTHRVPTVRRGAPQALRRPPSKLAPEVGPVEPITYYRLVKPVFEKSCVPCHQARGKGPSDMSFEALRPYVFHFSGGMRGHLMDETHGGSRSIPGRVGARQSRIGRALLNETHTGNVSREDLVRVVLWLDANAPRLGAFYDEERQVKGDIVWPKLDVDPGNPQGLER